jgi:hypothetical protein
MNDIPIITAFQLTSFDPSACVLSDHARLMFRQVLKDVSVNRLQMLGVEFAPDRVKAKLNDAGSNKSGLGGFALLSRFLFRKSFGVIAHGA